MGEAENRRLSGEAAIPVELQIPTRQRGGFWNLIGDPGTRCELRPFVQRTGRRVLQWSNRPGFKACEVAVNVTGVKVFGVRCGFSLRNPEGKPSQLIAARIGALCQ